MSMAKEMDCRGAQLTLMSVTPPKEGSGLSGRVTGFQVSFEKTVSMRTLTCWAEISSREVPSFTTAG